MQKIKEPKNQNLQIKTIEILVVSNLLQNKTLSVLLVYSSFSVLFFLHITLHKSLFSLDRLVRKFCLITLQQNVDALFNFSS